MDITYNLIMSKTKNVTSAYIIPYLFAHIVSQKKKKINKRHKLTQAHTVKKNSLFLCV